MRTVGVTAIVLFALSLQGCKDDSSPLNKLFGGKLDVVTGADRVEAFRVDWSYRGAPAASRPARPPTTQSVVGLPVLAGPLPVSATQASQLAKVLNDPATYAFESRKRCIFHPDVAIRFWLGDQNVKVVFCFSCDELEV